MYIYSWSGQIFLSCVSFYFLVGNDENQQQSAAAADEKKAKADAAAAAAAKAKKKAAKKAKKTGNGGTTRISGEFWWAWRENQVVEFLRETHKLTPDEIVSGF